MVGRGGEGAGKSWVIMTGGLSVRTASKLVSY